MQVHNFISEVAVTGFEVEFGDILLLLSDSTVELYFFLFFKKASLM